MTKSTITRERLEEIVSDPMINQGSEFAMMARMALVAMDSEPVILYRQVNPANGMKTYWAELDPEEFRHLKKYTDENAEFMTLYRHAQQPVAVTDDELNAALQLHRLKVDGHSQLSDAFRAGFRYARRTTAQSAVESDFIPKNLDKALGVLGMAIPESREEFNFQTERWIQRLIDRVIRYADEFQEQPEPVVPAVSDDIGEIRVGRLPTMNQDDYPGLGDWWVQLRIGEDSDEVLARVYGATPQEANNRAEALACRAAMLHAGNSPAQSDCCPAQNSVVPAQSGNSPAIPDGYVLVPKEATKGILDEFDSIIDYGAEDSVDAWHRLLAAAPQPQNAPQNIPEIIPDCWCRTCRPVGLNDMRFVVCPDCGNKRCPRANDNRNACTGSNEPGQEDSAYPDAPREVKP
ncbi:TPA: hypothetical protein ACN7PN_004371 [Klebsiella pneumoniae]